MMAILTELLIYVFLMARYVGHFENLRVVHFVCMTVLPAHMWYVHHICLLGASGVQKFMSDLLKL